MRDEQWIFFIITSLYSVRLKKLWMDKIKLLWWHLHEISENWAGRNNIAAWCVNSQLITNAGNLKFTATNSFNYPIINSLIESLGIRLTWLDCVQSPYWRKRFQAPDKTFRTHKLPIPSLNLYQVMWFDVFSRDLYCESRDKTSGTPVTSSLRSVGRFGSWFTVKITWQNVELHHLVKIPRWNRKLVCAKSFIWSLKPRLCYLQTCYWKKWTVERNIDMNVS